MTTTDALGDKSNRKAALGSYLEKAEAIHVLSALGNPIMVADSNYTILHCNEAGFAMFERLQSDIRITLPNFRARDIIGKNVDIFHKNPAYQRGLLDNLVEPHRGAFKVGESSVAFTASPVLDQNGQVQLILVEWRDVTDRDNAERRNAYVSDQFAILLQQMQVMAQAHDAGDIDVVIDATALEIPEIREAALRVNDMVTSHIDTKKKTVAVMEQFGEGNFDAEIETFPGKRGFINDAVEKVRNNFREVVREITRLSEALMAGKLDAQADLSKFKGEYLTIVQSFEAAFSSLNSAFGVMSEQIDQVAASVGQMSHASQVLSTNSQVTSASVEEVSASVIETDHQVQANAESSQKAATFVGTAAGLANQGADKIKDMVSAMHGIKASSQDIAKIIKVIDEIAFQTNLLALNAAVEAARAGQHGRGFAVVAQEVRNLAGRSAKAARETSDLIEDASNRVNAGVRIADETSEAFTGIAVQITQVKEIVEEIDRSSAEQSRGVAQISLAMSEISKSAMDTSQQADELAAGAAQMSAATEQMKTEVQRFTLRKGTSAMRVPDALSGLTPEILAQLQVLFGGRPAAPALPKQRSSLDLDERGFHGF